MALELLKKEPMNVIVVDWGQGSSVLNMYDAAAGNTRLVGVQVADLIDVLNRKFHVALKKFHIIGHSLGAQLAGFAGEKLRKGGKVIGRITGTTHSRTLFKLHWNIAGIKFGNCMTSLIMSVVDTIHLSVLYGISALHNTNCSLLLS